VSEVDLAPDLPFGTVQPTEYRSQDLPLEPGDRFVFLTDGMFGTATDAKLLAPAVALTGGLHPREAVQHLTRQVLADDGEALRDDATVLVLDWHGGPPRDRVSSSGANR
jgi:serine phosphatase RsbU (regulator of sigma subunit)